MMRRVKSLMSAVLSLACIGALSPAWGGEARGITQAIMEARLSMPVAGRVESLQVRQGSRVKAGQELLHLDRDLEALELERRRLQLADDVRLQELKRREATLLKQVQDLRELAQTGGVSRKQLQDETLAWQAAQSERQALEAAKQRERVDVKLARTQYARRHLRAPIAGVVTQLDIRPGESVVPHSPLMTVVDVSRVRFMGTVPAQDAQQLQVGDAVTVEVGPKGEALKRPAKLVYVAPVADASSGLVEVVAEFDNSDGRVRPGISGRMVY
jgi:RND family efflux transporter MFP subunit